MSLLVMLAIALVAWAWFDTMQAREAAVAAAGRYCAREDVQLLDETVALRHLGLTRRSGRLRIVRTYRFEYTASGTNREPGNLVMVGRTVVHLAMAPSGLPH